MLGILLSMTGELRGSAAGPAGSHTASPLTIGDSGQPATPLNNSGKVRREMFTIDKAEGSSVRGRHAGRLSMCFQIVDLTLYIDQLR